MQCNEKNQGKIMLKAAGDTVTLYFRRPSPGELIEVLVKKMPRGDEDDDARRILSANLELGISCLTGVEGLAGLEGVSEEVISAGRLERLAEDYPLLLIALGQHLSAVPSFMEETELKKS